MNSSDWLKETTGRTSAWWVAACQQAIKDASSPSDDPKHDQTDERKWMTEITRLVAESMPVPNDNGVPYDGNMRLASVMSVVLGLWYGRTGYAKAHDPARPVSLRQRAYHKWLGWAMVLTSVILDESEDATFYPNQSWDFPFSFKAKDGDFV